MSGQAESSAGTFWGDVGGADILQRFRTLVNTVDDGIYQLDPEGRFVAVNDIIVEMSGYDRDELIGEHISLVLDEEDHRRIERAIISQLETDDRQTETFELPVYTATGETIPCEVRLNLLTDDGEFQGTVGIVRDISDRKHAEDLIQERQRRRERERQLEAATKAADVGTWEWHVQEDKMVMGPTFARTFGIDPDIAQEGTSLDRFVSAIHENDREQVEQLVEEALESCGEYEVEYRVWNADDELRWVFARGQVECDENGTPVRFPGAVTDITDRKRAELQVRQNNEQLETLFEILPVGVVVAEADGAIVEANDVAHEIWGGDVFDAASVAEYEQYPVFEVNTGERVQPEEMTLARVLRGEEVTEPDVYEFHAIDGERRIVEVEGMPIWDEDGEVSRGVVTMSDVTERWEVQRDLEESEQRYRTLVENFPDGSVGLFNEDLEYTVVGGELLDRLDMDSEDRIGRSIQEIHSPDLLAEIEPHFEAALEGETNSFEVEFGDRHLNLTTLPVSDADEEIHTGMLVVQDVTERSEYERKLEESNERLEQFAYAASHDLQEPLRMVSSYLQLIEGRYEDQLDEDGREFLEFAVDGANRMREMIDALLQYSRVDTQGDPLEPVELDDVLRDVREDLQVKIEKTDAKITTESLPEVNGDPGHLRQVFQNLLDNAIEYSGDEPPQVHVGAERNGDEWVISVSDGGIGIDPEDADQIFQVFESLNTSDHSGTGIGLALCDRIVERHGGEIWVDSEPGDGSTFSFTLPAAGDGDE